MSRYGGPPHVCPRNIRPNSILVITSQDNILFELLQRWNCVVDWSRRLPTLTICKQSSLRCVDCPILPWQPAARCWLFAVRNTRSHITFVVRLNLLTDLPSQVQGLQTCIKKFRFTVVLFNIKIKAKLVGSDSNLRGYSNYLPVTRETTKLVSSGQMRSSTHCSVMTWSL